MTIIHPRRAVSGIQTASSMAVLVIGQGGGWVAVPAVHHAAGIARISHVRPERREDLGEAQDVGVEVKTDGRRLDQPAHAARTEVS